MFTACGTGEFNALDLAEYTKVVAASVTATGGRVPVFAGAGGPLPTAKALARAAADNGADGLLLMPPYLVTAPPDGLVRYVREVASAGGLPVIIYQRGTARFSPSAVATWPKCPRSSASRTGSATSTCSSASS